MPRSVVDLTHECNKMPKLIEKKKKKKTAKGPSVLTVGQLKQLLEEYSDDLPLIYATDDEGNGFRLVQFGPSPFYVRKSTIKTHQYLQTIDDKDEDFESDSVKCLCLN